MRNATTFYAIRNLLLAYGILSLLYPFWFLFGEGLPEWILYLHLSLTLLSIPVFLVWRHRFYGLGYGDSKEERQSYAVTRTFYLTILGLYLALYSLLLYISLSAPAVSEDFY